MTCGSCGRDGARRLDRASLGRRDGSRRRIASRRSRSPQAETSSHSAIAVSLVRRVRSASAASSSARICARSLLPRMQPVSSARSSAMCWSRVIKSPVVRRQDAAFRPGGPGSRIAAGDRRSRRAGEPKCEAQRSILGEPLVLEAGPPGLVHWKSRSDSGPGRFARRDGAVCRPFGAGSLTRWLSIAGEPIATESVDLKRRLFEAHGARERPLCLCRRPGVPMYVARVDGAVILKRMPLTGPHHDPTCNSYEPPPELSGRGEVLGAIAEDADDSAIRLRLDFSLSKRRGRSTPSTDEPDAARTDGSKLSLRALLHYLWEEAELNCWSQGMAGKRNWAVVRHRLAMAVAHKLVKGVPLARKLFIPETFAADRKAEIADRRRSNWQPWLPTDAPSPSCCLSATSRRSVRPASV